MLLKGIVRLFYRGREEGELLMKKVLPIIVFLITFIVTYIGISYFPSFRIKLEAEPLEYFMESITYMIGFKSIVAGIIGIVVGIILVIIIKYKK